MKREMMTLVRKHGAKAQARRQAVVDAIQCGSRSAGFLERGKRLTTTVTFASKERVYLWITDRGRSRLIKH